MGINRQPVDFEYVRFLPKRVYLRSCPPQRERGLHGIAGPATQDCTGDTNESDPPPSMNEPYEWIHKRSRKQRDMTMTEAVIKQHLIDPEICIRCNTCEAICPVGAITHDSRNYVVDADKCNWCMACISPCPTGSIDNWRTMPRCGLQPGGAAGLGRTARRARPENWQPGRGGRINLAEARRPRHARRHRCCPPAAEKPFQSAQYGATLPPWSRPTPTPTSTAPRPPRRPSPPPWWAMCASPKWAATTTPTMCAGLRQHALPGAGRPVIGIIPPGVDASGRPHHARQYSALPARATASGRATTTCR
jgi:benzoyl-CoA 2,3-dioxygenase component A